MTLAISLPLAIVIASSLSHGRQYVFHHENVLGTSLEVKVSAKTAAAADRAEACILTEIDRLAKILSGYDPESEFSRWMITQGQAVPVSADLFSVLSRFDRYRTLTAGALDPAAEVVTRIWKAHETPSRPQIEAAAAAARGPHWSLNPTRHTATHLSGSPLILNSFAKSYIAGRGAEAAMASPDVISVVVNIGGDLVVRGPAVEAVHITDPRNDAENAEPVARIQVRNRAVATSGNYRRGPHIVDPRSGQPVDHILSSTVVAADPSDAGALATAFCVLTPAESARVAAAIGGAEYLLIARDGRRFTSPGWSNLALAPAAAEPVPQTVPGQWEPDHELTIAFELARIKGRARRPYVAVWIADAKGVPVRTLALWHEKPRWLPDLRAWYKEHRSNSASVSSATRPPGKYTVKWDGKDNAGAFVKAGTYTVLIEAAREHGTYQILRQEMDFSGTPQQIELKGGTEIATASLDYRRKAN